jgi:mannose-6-phosphate isomerase-like protein (cupin superfamily)
MQKVNLTREFDLLDQYWSPKVLGELNGQYVKIAKVRGEFIWHHHESEDELFLVVEGRLTIKLPDQDVNLEEGEIFIVPRGVEHKPVAEEEAHILLFEPQSTLHMGNVGSQMTIKDP